MFLLVNLRVVGPGRQLNGKLASSAPLLKESYLRVVAVPRSVVSYLYNVILTCGHLSRVREPDQNLRPNRYQVVLVHLL
jgi:hypothetical protein